MPGRPSASIPRVPTDRSPLRAWCGLAAFYAATFAALAIYMQYLPVWLRDERGLGQGQIALVLSAQTIGRTVAGPLWSQRADRSGAPRAVLRWLVLLSLLAAALFLWVRSIPGLWLAAFCFGCVYSPMHAILDSLALLGARRGGFAYGRLRVVGSLAFLLVIVAVGWWLDHVSSAVVLWLLLGGLLATWLAGHWLPDERSPRATGKAPLGELLRSRPFVWLLVASAAIQGSHATYYNLSTNHWIAHGIGKGMAGVLWAEGVLGEMGMFFWARASVERLRPTTMMMIGGVGAAVRWCAIGSTTDLGWLLACNWLHALSFSCTYLGALRALERRVPEAQRATAQGLLGAANSGVGMVVCGLCGGWLYDRSAALAFFTMAAFALVGVWLAWWLRRTADRTPQPAQASASRNPA